MECDHTIVLDLAREGSWDEAHELVQQYFDELSCLIHAYLHRVEGNISNAKYWYNRVDVAMPNNNLEDELNRLYEMTGKPKKNHSQSSRDLVVDIECLLCANSGHSRLGSKPSSYYPNNQKEKPMHRTNTLVA